MKTSRVFAVAAALVVGFCAARLCIAQSTTGRSHRGSGSDDFGARQQLASFMACLQDAKQTNTLQRFNDYSTASLASRHYADLGVTLAVLERLRNGRTNEAFELLEGRLNTEIVGFVASYRELPASVRNGAHLKLLAQARDYRAKYPFQHRYPGVDRGVADALKILDEKN